jgi:hypothetical protein
MQNSKFKPQYCKKEEREGGKRRKEGGELGRVEFQVKFEESHIKNSLGLGAPHCTQANLTLITAACCRALRTERGDEWHG